MCAIISVSSGLMNGLSTKSNLAAWCFVCSLPGDKISSSYFKVFRGDFVNSPLCLITLLTRTVSFLVIMLISRAVGVWLFMLSAKLYHESRFALLTAFLKQDKASSSASQSSSCIVLMVFRQTQRASFRRLASSKFQQMLSFLRSEFRIGQVASYDFVITKWTLFASTSMSSFEEDWSRW